MLAYIQYLFLRAFCLFVNCLPEPTALSFGRLLGRTAFHLARGHRQVALGNLESVFGGSTSDAERRSIARRTFQHLGMTLVEFLRIPQMDPETLRNRVTVEGMEHLTSLLENREKGFFFLLAHLGNWELAGVFTKILGLKVSVIARPIKKNPWVDRMISEIRRGAGLDVIFTEKASRPVFRALSQNRIIGILIDQRAKRSEGVWVDFFGRKAPTTPALAVLAMRTGAPVVPVFFVREGWDRHRLIFREPLEMASTGDVKGDVERNTQRMNQVLEAVIREYPDQWFWVHRRWERKKKKRAP
jgi:KDO2-lipid IV(A) lauroyltransferase